MITYNEHIVDEYHQYLATLAMYRFIYTATEITTYTVNKRVLLTNEYYKSVKLTTRIRYPKDTILNMVTYNDKFLFYYRPLGI